jgi:hypothetical protein
VVTKAGAVAPLKTIFIEMADDLNQFFPKNIGTVSGLILPKARSQARG